MTIYTTGPAFTTTDGIIVTPAKSHRDETISLQATQEAIADYGWGTVLNAAEDKHLDLEPVSSGQVIVLKITSKDCQEWLDRHT
jgi:hypothetical protein